MDPKNCSLTFEIEDGAAADQPLGGLLMLQTSSSDTTQFPDAGNSSFDFHEQSTSSRRKVSQEQHGVATRGFHARGRAWCRRLGMSATAWDGWAKLHVNPWVAMGHYFVSIAPTCMTPVYMCTGIRGEGYIYYVVLVPLVLYTIVCTATATAFWRWGPAVAHHKLYQPVSAFGSLGMLPILYVGFLGPEATIPWHNSLQWLVVCCINSFALLQATSAGSLPGEHPAEPRTSITGPVLQSAVQALLLLDALSDLGLIRSLLEGKHEGCWWFGQPGRCGSWNILIATFIVAAGSDFLLVFIKIFLGNETSSKSPRMQRLTYGMEMLCILCELVVAVCTLVYLFNLQRTIDSGQEKHMGHGSREMALGFLSLGFTVATLVVMAIGTDKIAQSGRSIWARVSVHLGATVPLCEAANVHPEVNMRDVPVNTGTTEGEGQVMADNIGMARSHNV